MRLYEFGEVDDVVADLDIVIIQQVAHVVPPKNLLYTSKLLVLLVANA